MTFVPVDHPEARAEYLAAVAYYEDQRAGLGAELVTRFEATVAEIVADPEAWPPLAVVHGEPLLRSRRVATFGYRVVYYRRGDQIRIVAYAHPRREPAYWSHRVEGRPACPSAIGGR